MAKNQNTFAKRQREMEKKRKQEEKRSRRIARKTADPTLQPLEANEDELECDEVLTGSDDARTEEI